MAKIKNNNQKPNISNHFKAKTPSAIRIAQINFSSRKDRVAAVNVGIGNVSLPLHPAVRKRLFNLDRPQSPFKKGVVGYAPSVGEKETRQAFLNIIAASGLKTNNLHVQITSGASQAMELIFLGTTDPHEKPVLLIEPAYANYPAMAQRTNRRTVSIKRTLQPNGQFTLPDMGEIEKVIKKNQPAAMVVIPYDNPAGQFFNRQTMFRLASLCTKHNLWLVSDEAYRELYYDKQKTSSVWGVTEKEVPGITGRRISLESSSKVWNGCGLRIGALVTDNFEFHQKAVAEYTADLCANAIGQYAFAALANEKKESLKKWFASLRSYYQKMMFDIFAGFVGQ